MLLESSLTTFLRHRKESLRIFALYMKKMIASQVESLCELCSFNALLNCHYAHDCLDLCNECNDLVGYSTVSFSL